jgi:hypothetical protein
MPHRLSRKLRFNRIEHDSVAIELFKLYLKKKQNSFIKSKLNYSLNHSPNRPFQNYQMPRKAKQDQKESPQGARSVGVVQKDQPPSLQGTMTSTHTFRFVATASQNNVITFAGLAAIGPGVVDTVNSIVVPLCSTYKLRKVEVWSPAAAGGDAVSNITFTGPSQGYIPDSEKLRTVLGSATPGYVMMRPPKGSLVRFWINPINMPNTTFFQISCPANSIVDITIVMRFSNEIGVTARPIGAGALGQIVYMALDNAAAAGSHNLVPYGLPTAF